MHGIYERYAPVYTRDQSETDPISGAMKVPGSVRTLGKKVLGGDDGEPDGKPAITLADLDRRVRNCELGIAILAQGDGSDDDGSDQPGAGPDENSPAQSQGSRGKPPSDEGGFDETGYLHPPKVDRPRPGMDNPNTADRRFLASKVGHYNRRLTANTNVTIASINQRNRQAYDQRTGALRTA